MTDLTPDDFLKHKGMFKKVAEDYNLGIIRNLMEKYAVAKHHEQVEKTDCSQLVSGCLFTKEDLQKAWMHGELRVPKEHRHLNNFDEYFKHEYKTKEENYGGLQIP